MRGILLASLFLTGFVLADEPYGSIADLQLASPKDKEDMPTVPAPDEATVLFDGKSFDNWVHKDGKTAVKWKLDEALKAMQVTRNGDIITREKFGGPFKLHVEFRVPYEPKNKGQGRGNSGVYVQGRYEVQVLDIYGIASPKTNACKAPTVWQTYDIDFTPPVCEDGKKVKNGRITVIHNGVKIHDDQEITKDNTTSGLGGDVCQPGPILLQDHGNPVQYRNIWIKTEKK